MSAEGFVFVVSAKCAMDEEDRGRAFAMVGDKVQWIARILERVDHMEKLFS